MTSETDLSTADLAQPGGTRPQDRADDDRRRAGRPDEAATGSGERSYETSGNRVAQGRSDDDTVVIPPVAPGGGSTRNDALQSDEPHPGNVDTPGTGRGMSDRDMDDRDMGDRGTGGMGDRDMGDRDMPGQGVGGDRDMTDRDMTDRDMGDRDMGDRGMAGQGMAGQGMAGQGMAGQGMGDRDTGGAGMTDRGAGAGDTGGDVALLDPTDADGFRQRWSDAQTRFVDDPREAVQTADGLVAELMQTLASSFSEHRSQLEAHWNSGGDPDTEDLRQALQRYRSFFDRLLSA
jgi:hypothetical protein